ncbi:hypothetical protein AB0958_26050 [Streptomyces sp. NPDC006655]|uniref:hypothetical protein n=1 Tax=Streptomyces sp. NPDC006655 TaxID=3156898 RepID=UPI00345607CE
MTPRGGVVIAGDGHTGAVSRGGPGPEPRDGRELRRCTEPLGLWPDTSGLTVEQTAEAIPAHAERARAS